MIAETGYFESKYTYQVASKRDKRKMEFEGLNLLDPAVQYRTAIRGIKSAIKSIKKGSKERVLVFARSYPGSDEGGINFWINPRDPRSLVLLKQMRAYMEPMENLHQITQFPALMDNLIGYFQKGVA